MTKSFEVRIWGPQALHAHETWLINKSTVDSKWHFGLSDFREALLCLLIQQHRYVAVMQAAAVVWNPDDSEYPRQSQ